MPVRFAGARFLAGARLAVVRFAAPLRAAVDFGFAAVDFVERLAVEAFAVERLAGERLAVEAFAVERLAPVDLVVLRFAVALVAPLRGDAALRA